MNIFHRWYCNSEGWRNTLTRYGIPWALGDADLGDDVLEIGPGPGMSTDWLRERVARLTSIEIDHKLAQSLTERMAGTNVTVVEGDATDMPCPDNSFSAAVCFTMLHHVPSSELQDSLLTQAHRVLRPGALFLGSDSTPSLRWRLYHVFDDCMPVDPDAFGARLERAGFAETVVDWNRQYNTFRFRARKAG
jgi:SAM-dependent methyltransferase